MTLDDVKDSTQLLGFVEEMSDLWTKANPGISDKGLKGIIQKAFFDGYTAYERIHALPPKGRFDYK